LERYGEKIGASHGKLFLSGVGKHAREQLDRTGTTEDLLGEENVFETTEVLGASVLLAYEAAQDWLDSVKPERSGDHSDVGSPDGGPALKSGSDPDKDQTNKEVPR
jgi:hypothetical protein